MFTRFSPPAPVVALHASASGPSQWRRLGEDLAARHSFLAIDMTACDDTDRTDAPTCLMAHASYVIRKIEDLGERVHLVGHAFGGVIALKVALMRPDLVVSLTLHEPLALSFVEKADEREAADLQVLRKIAAELDGPTALDQQDLGVRMYAAFWHGRDQWDHLPETTRQRLASGAKELQRDLAALFADDLGADDLAALALPVLVLSGMESPVIAERISARVATALPNARLAILPSLGHMAPLTDPDWVNPRIRQHIAETERDATRVCWPKAAAA